MRKLYLHWTGTSYMWDTPGHYHAVITGDGKIIQHQPFGEDLGAHTFGRNTSSDSIAIACMGGTRTWDMPPTTAQIEAMCRLAARWYQWFQVRGVDMEKQILTHAEAASNRDFPLAKARQASGVRPRSTPHANELDAAARRLGLPHWNYGPQRWHDGWPGGYAERWDLWQLKSNDQGGIGGFRLRTRIREILKTL